MHLTFHALSIKRPPLTWHTGSPQKKKLTVAFNTQVQKKTIRKAKHNNTQSLSISCGKTRGFTAQGSVNKRLNQIELQKMKGKHEWGNEGADVVSDQITISSDYWRGKRLIELFYHTESLRRSPHTKTNIITTLVSG